MTRGPQPLKAIARAKTIAGRQGIVGNNRTLVQSRCSFILFRNDRTVFVRVRRIRAHVTEPKEILLLFRTDVLQLRMIPKTPVTSREIWTLSPWKTWQFFVVGDESLTEVRYEVPPEVPLPEKSGTGPAPSMPAPGIPATTGSSGTDTGGSPGAPAAGSPGSSVKEGVGPSVGGEDPGRGVQA